MLESPPRKCRPQDRINREFMEARACEFAGNVLMFCARVCRVLTAWERGMRYHERATRFYRRSVAHHDRILSLLASPHE